MLGNFGRYIKEKRLQLDLSREKLAEIADTTSTVIYRVETGKEKPGEDLSSRIQEALGVSINNEIVEEPIQDSIETMKATNDKIEEYKEFRSIIRHVTKMNRDDLHTVYEFVNALYAARRKL